MSWEPHQRIFSDQGCARDRVVDVVTGTTLGLLIRSSVLGALDHIDHSTDEQVGEVFL